MKRILLIILVLALVVGCSPSSGPEGSLEALFEASKKLDSPSIAGLIDPANQENISQIEEFFQEDSPLKENNPVEKNLETYFKDSAQLISYRVLESEVKGEEARFKIEVDHVESKELLQRIFMEIFSRAFEFSFEDFDPDEIYSDIIRDVMPEKLEATGRKILDLELVRLDKKWYFKELGEDYLDVLSAGFLTAASSLDFFGEFEDIDD